MRDEAKTRESEFREPDIAYKESRHFAAGNGDPHGFLNQRHGVIILVALESQP